MFKGFKMREIKFRGWDEQKKIMHNDVEFIRSGVEGNDWIIFKSDKQKLEDDNVLNNPYFQQQIKIMQYTGLKDKNGVEIYEGDIVRTTCNIFRDEKDNIPYISEIKYIKDNCGFKAYDLKFESCHSKVENLKSEVIGNIYENEGLLK